MQILTTVVAVGAALYGVQAPVRAAQVTYNIENAALENGWSVTGSLDFDGTELDGGSVSVIDGIGQIQAILDSAVNSYDSPYGVELENQTGTSYVYIEIEDSGGVIDLTGAAGEVEPIAENGDAYLYYHVSTSPRYTNFVSGSVVSEAPSVPEPSSILETVTAVMLGVGLRRMKRKV